MSRTSPEPLQAAALRLACDYCGAQPGAWCRARSGRAARWLHEARERVVRTVWRFAYCSSQADAAEWVRNDLNRAGMSRYDLPRPVTPEALDRHLEKRANEYADHAADAAGDLIDGIPNR